MKITIIGAGYVGIANALLLARTNSVTLYDINSQKIEMLNKRISPIKDKDIEIALVDKELDLLATSNPGIAFNEGGLNIICTNTNYNELNNSFDTESIEQSISLISKFQSAPTIIIKSTVPIGFSKEMIEKFAPAEIIFSPEFLREGMALHDNFYPSRIIIGSKSKEARNFAKMLIKAARKDDIEVIFTESAEAEAIKLLSNTYLAMRIAFFNELDSFAETYNLNSRDVIKGVSLDPRIGNFYNNPSFGYGGYCLPKDTKQLKANYQLVPNDLIDAIVNSNCTRKDFIVEQILKVKPKIVGIYRLIMKSESDNFRNSSVKGIIRRLKDRKIKVVLYEPLAAIQPDEILKSVDLINDIEIFKDKSDIIVANRLTKDLDDVI